METNHIHVCCLSETFLKDDIKLPAHPKFITYRLDRPEKRKGGVAIVVRKTIKHRLLPSLGMKYVEQIGIQVYLINSQNISIYSLYVPGTNDIDSVNHFLVKDLRKLSKYQNSFFACGDLNAHHRAWNCVRANRAGTLLYDEMCRGTFFIESPDEPTHYPVDKNKKPSTIDLLLTNKLHQHSELTLSKGLISDHNAVEFTIDTKPEKSNQTSDFFDYKNAEWEKYCAVINQKLSIIANAPTLPQECQQIDESIAMFTNLILEAQDISVPKKRRNSYKLDLPDKLLKAIKIKNTLKRKWQRTRDSQLKSMVNYYERLIKESVNSIKNENWSYKLSQIDPDNVKVWKTAKILKKKNIIPPLKIQEKILLTTHEKAEAIAESFENNHINPLMESDPTFTLSVNNNVRVIITDKCDEDILLTNYDEISLIIRRLKNNKCPGEDKITNRLLKQLPPKGVKFLVKIINNCLISRYFPCKWKCANVVPIAKPGKKKNDPTGYRPISLLSSVSKILERIILSRLETHIDNNNIIPDIQHGFRKNYSTTHQIHRVIKRARDALRRKESTGLIALDIEKAFDRVWIEGLISKMIALNFPTNLVQITHSFLSERTFRVTINGTFSSLKRLEAGLPQGAVLSPTLYNLYTHDIPTNGSHQVAQYADDTLLFKSAPSYFEITQSLKYAASNLIDYLKRWKINVNNNKTNAVYITKRRKLELPSGPINIFGSEIEWTSSIKYLGVELDSGLTYKTHVEKVIAKANTAIKILYPLINRYSKLHVNNKITIYKLAIRPILTYAMPALTEMAPSHIRKIQTIQNKVIKMILNRPWFESTDEIHRVTNLPRIDCFIEKLTKNFHSKLINLT
ncbi:hypothetical protein PVAND_003264 [Polypedilum vanderplanki]|uniref:Reverse transcriptase domain-containing protein n=1 Tax=Polypedilum vanderplanki TaxID=319348 RepID=A0A9J6BUI1_POLVA|nr:hypothetical protein PVAND_003264 [Polypedilum vanderplanki]